MVAGEAKELGWWEGESGPREEVGTTQLQQLKSSSSVAKTAGRAETFDKTE